MQDFAAMLAATPEFAAAEKLAVLAEGATRTTWKIRCDGEHFVARFCRNNHGLPLPGVAAEYQFSRAAAAAGLAPEPVYADVDSGLLVSRFAEGRSWTERDLRQPEQLQRLKALLARLHQLQPQGPAFDPLAAVQAYATELGTEFAVSVAETASIVVDGLPEVREPFLCHNDLLAGNIVDSAAGLLLIDWEFAALGDPYFDLAVMIRHHNLSAEQEAVLVSNAASERIAMWGRYYDCLLTLWLLVLQNRGGLDSLGEARLKCLFSKDFR